MSNPPRSKHHEPSTARALWCLTLGRDGVRVAMTLARLVCHMRPATCRAKPAFDGKPPPSCAATSLGAKLRRGAGRNPCGPCEHGS